MDEQQAPSPSEVPQRSLPATPVRVTATPYTSSYEHLCDELRRLDLLLRGQTRRWHETIAATKPQQTWGMVHVTDAEVDAYLATPFTPPHELPGTLEGVLAEHWRHAEQLADAIERRRQSTPETTQLRVDRVVAAFGLSSLERDALLLCVLPELDARYRRLYAYLQDDASRTRPSVELIQQTLYPVARSPGAGDDGRVVNASRAIFDAESPLVAFRLVCLGDSGAVDDPLPLRPVRADDRIASYLVGSDREDSRLRGVLSTAGGLPDADARLARDHQGGQVRQLVEWWRVARERSGRGAALLHGPYGSGRCSAARAFCAGVQAELLVADVDAALRAACGWEVAIELCYREARLRNAALYWKRCELLLDRDQPAHRWESLTAAAERFPGVTLFGSPVTWDPVDRFRQTPFLRLEFPAPDFAARRRLWRAHLPLRAMLADGGVDRDAAADLLANAFQLTGGQMLDAITTAVAQAVRRDPATPRLTLDDLHDGCRRQSSRNLSVFARRIEPRTALTFDDLVLPDANARQVRELRARIRHRNTVSSSLGFERRITIGRGLIALFTGGSGTGKTMAAELLAREQGVDLYKVDLSAVVSKWVGETEKNLSRVFAEAEDTNAMIFFDEADALFGKRGEVKEAQDRWANMETNYLLQRVEEYAGVVILASNLRQNIDEAFMRRIHVVVEFPFPDAPARSRILAALFPPTVGRPSAEELAVLAERFPLPGGSLKNVVLDAVFRSLAERTDATPTITVRHLVLAIAREYQKAGKPITRGEFGTDFHRWVETEIL
jgi:ATP-dependent 26S proteasome regulatory subunit